MAFFGQDPRESEGARKQDRQSPVESGNRTMGLSKINHYLRRSDGGVQEGRQSVRYSQAAVQKASQTRKPA